MEIDKVIPLIEKHGPEILDYIHEHGESLSNSSKKDTEEKISELNDKVTKLIDKKPAHLTMDIEGATVEVIEGPPGDKGDKGDKGDEPSNERLVSLIEPLIPEPLRGDDGHTPTSQELFDIILPLIPKPIKGDDGHTPTADEILSIVSPYIPDMPEQIVETSDTIVSKINKSKSKIKKEVIDIDWKKYENKAKEYKIEDIKGLPETIKKLQYSHAKAKEGYDQVSGAGGGSTAGAVSSVNGETGTVVLDTSDIADTTNKRYVTDTDLTNLAGVTSNIQTQLDVAPITNERLTAQTFPNAIAGNIGSGDIDIYTCPVGKRAIVNMITLSNTAGTTTTYFMQLKVSSVYYRISSSATLTAGTSTNLQSYSLILEAGESLSINTSQAGLNVFPTIIEFPNTAKSRTIKNLSIVSGDNTIYTVPSGKTAILLSATTIRAGTGAIQYVNTSASTATYSMHISSSTSSASTNRFASSSLTTLLAGTQSIGTMIPSTYSIVLNTNQTGGIAYVSVIEVDN